MRLISISWIHILNGKDYHGVVILSINDAFAKPSPKDVQFPNRLIALRSGDRLAAFPLTSVSSFISPIIIAQVGVLPGFVCWWGDIWRLLVSAVVSLAEVIESMVVVIPHVFGRL